MANPTITIPNVDPNLVQKLNHVVSAIESAVGKFNAGSSGINSTNTSVNSAIGAIAADSSGQMVIELTTNYWPNTKKDGTKAHDALVELTAQLNSLKSTISENLPAITTGMAAIQTAQRDESGSTKITQQTADNLQGQINGLITALAAIASAAGPVSSKIEGIKIGGACATGIQPGGPLPNFDNTALMTTGGGQPRLFEVDSQGEAVEITPGGGGGGGGDNGSGSGDNGGGSGDNGGGGGGDEGGSWWQTFKQWLSEMNNAWKATGDAAWRKAWYTKLLVGYGVGAANNILTSIIAGHWLWGPFATGGAASFAANYALAGLPFPENAIAQTLIGQAVNVGTYEITKGSGGSKTPSNTPTTTKLSNGWTKTTQQLPNGQTETTVSEPDGTSLTTITSKNGTTELLKNIDGSGEMIVTTKSGTTVTTINSNGQTSTTKLPAGQKPPVLLQVPSH